MATNTVFMVDYIVVKQGAALVAHMHQRMYLACSDGIKQKRRLYGYDFQ